MHNRLSVRGEPEHEVQRRKHNAKKLSNNYNLIAHDVEEMVWVEQSKSKQARKRKRAKGQHECSSALVETRNTNHQWQKKKKESINTTAATTLTYAPNVKEVANSLECVWVSWVLVPFLLKNNQVLLG